MLAAPMPSGPCSSTDRTPAIVMPSFSASHIKRKSFPRQLKRCNRLRTSYGGELIEKDFEAVASLKVVEQDFDGNARTDEYRRSAQNLRIAVHDEILIDHCRILTSNSGHDTPAVTR
jgi:hypothetical protein